jgi:hypothetical protein
MDANEERELTTDGTENTDEEVGGVPAKVVGAEV